MEIHTSNTELLEWLAEELPKDVTFKIYYLCTPQTQVPSLYTNFGGKPPHRTFCTKHFLVVAINVFSNVPEEEQKEIFVYAIEIFIYSTIENITIFVSKADSTGYLDILELPKNTPSPIRIVTTTFLQYLIKKSQRPEVKINISLFARAQDQYLFPCSAEYKGKHVLHDSGLIRWWCHVLNPIVKNFQPDIESSIESTRGYIIVPGLDAHEALSFVPNRKDNLWIPGHPLLEISISKGNIPPRYLIPHFPDDPKARFSDDLDEEIIQYSNSDGQWKSIKTLDQFWEMMAFRQECSAGRLVGFIWIVISAKKKLVLSENVISDSKTPHLGFNDINMVEDKNNSVSSGQYSSFNISHKLPPPDFHQTDTRNMVQKSSKHEIKYSKSSIFGQRSRKKRRKLTGKITSRTPRLKIGNSNTSTICSRFNHTTNPPLLTEGLGQITVDDSDYRRIIELLLNLDFSKLERALFSSRRWIREACCADHHTLNEQWGQTVTGQKVMKISANVDESNFSRLNPNLVPKRRKNNSVLS